MPKSKKINMGELGNRMMTQATNIRENTPSALPPSNYAEVTENTPRGKAGRKKVNRIKRTNVMSLYLEDKHWEMLEDAHYNSRVNKQRIIQCALEQFISKYFENKEITPEGLKLINEYEDSISI